LTELSRKRERERLPIRREPHWQRLNQGAALGFRRGPDTWVVRFRGRDGKQQYKSLGEALEFDEAKSQAESWLSQLAGSAVRSVKRSTVREALEAYLADLRRHGRSETAHEAEGRFKTVIHNDVLVELELESVTRDDFLEWRDRLLEGRQARTVNRNVRAVVAALNYVVDLGYVGNPAAWKLKALSDDVEESGETAVFLDAVQRKAVIDAASPHAALFLRGLELTGARPKELAAAIVADFNGHSLRLAHRKGRPAKLRPRHVVLSADAIAFFKVQSNDKVPGARLFTEDGETPWRRHIWAREIRAAIEVHNREARGKHRISPKASAYSFRHARISELLQVYGVDPLTVAAQTGTSLVMIEKAYLRFIPSVLQEKLAAIKSA
jgi:integrase